MHPDLHAVPPVLCRKLIRHEQLCHIFARDHCLRPSLALGLLQAFRFEALTQSCSRSMHQPPKVSDAHIENLTNLACVKSFDFSQDECLTLVYWQTVHAAANQLADLIREHQPFQIGGRATPVAVSVKTGFEHPTNRSHALVHYCSTA